MYCMYLAECVCIDAPSNFCCRKYKQIHTIQTNTFIIHTPILPTYIQKYIQNKSVTMCMYVHVYACICLYFVCMSVFFSSKDMIWRACCMCMYLHVSVCISWLPLFTRGYICAVGLHLLHRAWFQYMTCNWHVMSCNYMTITCITWISISLHPHYIQHVMGVITPFYMNITCRARC